MLLWSIWEYFFGKEELLWYLLPCAGLFTGLVSLKRPYDVFLRAPFEWFSDFLKELWVAFGGVLLFVGIYWSTFVDWNKWTPALAQLTIVGIVASSLAWVGFSQRIKAHKYNRLLFWGMWAAAALVLGLLINRLLYLLPLVYLFFGNWAEENEKINSYHHTPSH